MANVIIKTNERREHEEFVLRSFCGGEITPDAREAAECVAARAREARDTLKHRGGYAQ